MPRMNRTRPWTAGYGAHTILLFFRSEIPKTFAFPKAPAGLSFHIGNCGKYPPQNHLQQPNPNNMKRIILFIATNLAIMLVLVLRPQGLLGRRA